MSHWNYRVIRFPEEDGGFVDAICEVYYDENGNPNARTDPVPVYGDNVGVILRMMQLALTKPALSVDLTKAPPILKGDSKEI